MDLTEPTRRVDVLVVGAGPAGLTVAGDLARAGRSVAVLERRPVVNPSSRAFTTNARTLEVLDARGLAEDLLARGARVESVDLFGGARIDLTRLRSRYPFVLVIPQGEVDAALAGYATAHGADVRRGVEVVGLSRDAAGVTVAARPSGNDDPAHRSTWRADWVVAADGAHSTVRNLLGLPFPGERVLSGVVLADVKLARAGDVTGLTLSSDRDGYAMLAPYARHDRDGSWFRSITWDRNSRVAESEAVREREIGGVLTRSLGRDPGLVEVGSRSRFHCDERQVPSYRVDRVLLAGDAAHVHSPMGGQGLNTGIQDAANLAWKLDAVLGSAGEAVLDSYHRERHPVGRYALRQSGMMLRSTVLHPRPARWLRDQLAPRLLALPPVLDAVSGGLAGTTHHYRRCGDRTRLVGTRATEVPLAEGRLTVLQRRPGFLLVRDRDSPLVADAGGLPQAVRTDDGPALLVRPDGYLAWAGSLREAPAGGRWQDALAAWTQPAR